MSKIEPPVVLKKSERVAIDGIVLLDKPSGISSNGALQKVKTLFKAKKAGHTGSLDPLASGLLPVCLGQATKITQFLLEAGKTYLATARLGVTTTTGDKEGEVVSTQAVPDLSESQINQVLAKFLGPQNQVPSMYSAIKHKGQPLYKLARLGIEVPRQARLIHIYALTLEGFEKTADGVFLSLKIRCSKGTYVRTLSEDIGQALGCGGAHVTALRRTELGPFLEKDMITLDALRLSTLSHLLPIQRALLDWPSVQLSEQSAFYIQRGQAVQAPGAPKMGWVQLFGPSQCLIGLGEILEDGRVAPRRMFLS